MEDEELLQAEPQQSLDDVVRAAYEQHNSKPSAENDGNPSPSDPAGPEVGADTRPRDASGKFTARVERTEQVAAPRQNVTTDAVQPTEQPVQQSQAGTPPRGWSAEEKALWSKLPPAIQTAVSRREAQMDEGARQWTEQRTAVEQALSPLHELSQANGIHWKDGLDRLLNVEARLRNPATAAQTVAEMARAYNVDLAALVNGTQQPAQPQQPYFDPNIILQNVEQRVEARLAAREEQTQLNSMIGSFEGERDQAGKVLHPHFNEVKVLMGHLLKTEQASDLQDAYDKAVWATPGIRTQLMSAQTVAQQPIRQAARSRAAAVSVKGAPSGKAPNPSANAGKSLDDIVRDAYAEHAGGTA